MCTPVCVHESVPYPVLLDLETRPPKTPRSNPTLDATIGIVSLGGFGNESLMVFNRVH